MEKQQERLKQPDRQIFRDNGEEPWKLDGTEKNKKCLEGDLIVTKERRRWWAWQTVFFFFFFMWDLNPWQHRRIFLNIGLYSFRPTSVAVHQPHCAHDHPKSRSTNAFSKYRIQCRGLWRFQSVVIINTLHHSIQTVSLPLPHLLAGDATNSIDWSVQQGWITKTGPDQVIICLFILFPVFLRWHHRGKGKKFTKPVSIIGWDKDVIEEPCGWERGNLRLVLSRKDP